MTIFLNEDLHEKAKEIADRIYYKPSAYKSGYIVKMYKTLGGKFADNGDERRLSRWFREKWTDIGNRTYPVFRPTEKVNKNTPLLVSEIDPKNLKKQIALKQRIRGNKNLPKFIRK